MKKGNRAKYDKYKNNKTREKNKVRKLTKYTKKHPNDLQTVKVLEEYRAKI